MKFRASLLLFVLLAPLAAGGQSRDIRANPDRMEQRIKALGEYGTNPEGGVSRVAFSDADLAGRAYIMDLMREADLSVRVDTAGNIIGRREGREEGLPVITPTMATGTSGRRLSCAIALVAARITKSQIVINRIF